jgi:hypothetical protein
VSGASPIAQYISDDWAWLASDAVGRVGIFTTASVAPIPVAALNHAGNVDRAEELVRGLPRTGNVQLVRKLSCPDDYVLFAARGLYAFDWAGGHRYPMDRRAEVYDLIARPLVPITLERLPDEIRAIADIVLFNGIVFFDTPELAVAALVDCVRCPR